MYPFKACRACRNVIRSVLMLLLIVENTAVPAQVSRTRNRSAQVYRNYYQRMAGSGNAAQRFSIRIHRPDMQSAVFELLGIGAEEARAKFGFLLDALNYGAPPHGGIAFGIDRIAALMAGTDSIRDVIPFPKTTGAQDLTTDAPSPIAADQLAEVHVQVRPKQV